MSEPSPRAPTAVQGGGDQSPVGRSPHSLLVLAPIGCWSGSLALDVASRFSADPGLMVSMSTWLVGVGLMSAVVAGFAGMVEAAPVPAGTMAHRRVLVHLYLVLTVMVLYAFGLILRLAAQVGQPATTWTLALSAFGLLVLGMTGYVGRTVSRIRRAGGVSRRPSARSSVPRSARTSTPPAR